MLAVSIFSPLQGGVRGGHAARALKIQRKVEPEMPLGIVTGMGSEARIFGADALTISTGGDPGATRAGIASLIARGADRLVSFGIAGALDPSLKPGDLIIGVAVRTTDGVRMPVDQKWLAHLTTHLTTARVADVVGSTSIAATAEQKAMLHRDTGAASVDQESHWVADAAHANHLPFIVIRAIADRAGDSLPPAVLVGLDAQGNPRTNAIIGALLRDPLQLPGLIRVALQTNRALRSLLRGRAALLV
jgi:hopanoid-associated phosphorylase